MKRVTARRIAIPRSGVPEISVEYVTARLKEKKQLDQKEPILAFLNDALADYWSQKVTDEASATPAQVRAYAERLEAVASQLDPKDGTEATILNAVISPFDFDDRVGKIKEVVATLRALQDEVGDPRKGSGERLMHRRQVRLAERFWVAFNEKGWPLQTSANSLMAQLLLAVLKAADESRGTIKQLLEETRPN